MNIAFFGTDDFSVKVLEKLKQNNVLPKIIVTTKDKPQGRKLVITPSPAKVWAKSNNIQFLEPDKLNSEFIEFFSKYDIELSIVASYGKIIPESVLDIPKFKTLNLHPSLLPKLRGASPLQTAILEENETGVTIIKLDKEMDHGPILAQEKLNIIWPPYLDELKDATAKLGAEMLCKIITLLPENKVIEIEQDHSKATFTKKIQKKDAEIKLSDSSEINLRKIRAFSGWLNAFFYDDNKRVVVKTAHIENGELILERVIPEGKKEMDYKDYLRGKK